MADEKIPVSEIKTAVLAVRELQVEVRRLAQIVAAIGARLEKLESKWLEE